MKYGVIRYGWVYGEHDSRDAWSFNSTNINIILRILIFCPEGRIITVSIITVNGSNNLNLNNITGMIFQYEEQV